IVVVFLVGGEQAEFNQGGPVGNAVEVAWDVAVLDRRDAAYEFLRLKGDELDAFAAAEVVGGQPVAHRLEELIVAYFFLEPRGDGDQRSYPMRLIALDLCDARKPIYEIILDRRADLRAALRAEW